MNPKLFLFLIIFILTSWGFFIWNWSGNYAQKQIKKTDLEEAHVCITNGKINYRLYDIDSSGTLTIYNDDSLVCFMHREVLNWQDSTTKYMKLYYNSFIKKNN